MHTIMLVFGTRPEAIKMAPVVRELERRTSLKGHVLVTAQHRHMLDQVLDVLEIPADGDLDLMRPDQTLAGFTGRAIEAVTAEIARVRPSMVLVHGDTSTAFVGALAGFYNQIPVGHVEAGLRTDTLYSPFPEEANRRLVGRLAQYHYAPTQVARENLLRESVAADCIEVTGNTVIDSLHWVRDEVLTRRSVRAELEKRFAYLRPERRLMLVTNHRRENFGAGMDSVYRALRVLASRFEDVDVVFPIHLNPQARKPALEILGDVANVHLIEPVEYVQFVYLMSRSHLIITDSGGVQEEAPSLDVPVLVTRETTERPEAVEAGTALLVGVDHDLIVREATRLLTDDSAYRDIVDRENPYGDGHAAARIVDHIENLLVAPA